MQRLAVARSHEVYVEKKSRLGAIDQEIAGLQVYNAAIRQQRLDIELLLATESYHSFLVSQREEQAAAVERAWARCVEAREELLAFQKDRKLLQRLREKRWLGYYQDFLTVEQKNLDEIGIIRSGGQGRRLRRNF